MNVELMAAILVVTSFFTGLLFLAAISELILMRGNDDR